MSGRYLTPQDVAERYQLSAAGVTRALREGRLPGVKILGRWRVDPRRLEQALASPPQAEKEDVLAEVRRLREAGRG